MVRQKLGVTLALRTLFEHSSIAALAIYLEEAKTSASAPVVPIRAARRTAARVAVRADGTVVASGGAD